MHSKKLIIIIFLISLIVFTGPSVFRDITYSTNFSLCVVSPLFSQTWADFELKDEERLSLETQRTPTFLEPCSEDKRSEDTLHFDGPNYFGIGTSIEQYSAVRFTPDVSGTLVAIIFYYYENSTLSGNAYVYKDSIATNPGPAVRVEPYSVTEQGWHRIDLSTSYPYVAGVDFWTGIMVTDYPAGENPMGLDSGPAVAGRGDWISFDGVTWAELQHYGYDYNWNERAIVHQEGGGIEELRGKQQQKARLEVYPNPFGDETVIRYSLLNSKAVLQYAPTLKIYDLSGRLVKSLSLTTDYSALGTAVSWDGTNDRGNKVLPGLYFCHLTVGKYRVVKKIIKLY